MSDTQPYLPSAIVAEHFELQVPSQPEWIVPTVAYLEQKAVLSGACQESRVSKVAIALHEAVTNGIVHGNLEVSSELKDRDDNAFAELLATRAADPAYGDRQIGIEVDRNSAGCTWTLTDQGRGFDVERVLRRHEEDPEAPFRLHGRGILLMKAFFDDVRYDSGGRRVRLSLRSGSRAEQRKHQRFPMHQPVRVAPIGADGSVDWGATYDAVARNLSADGIGLLQTRLAHTDRVLIGFDCDGRVMYVPAEVRNCRSTGGVVEIGCRFQPSGEVSSPTPASEVQKTIDAMMSKLEAGQLPKDDRRAHQRVIYTGRVGISGGPPSEPTFGFSRDLSRGGLAFVTTLPMALGCRTFALPQPDGGCVKVRAEIVRCVPIVSGIFDVGARFVDDGAAEPVRPSVVASGAT